MGKNSVVFTFPSTYHALKAEKALKDMGYIVSLRPIPRELTSNCGEVIQTEPEQQALFTEIFQKAGVQVEEVHQIAPREKSGLLDKFFGF